MLFFSGDFTRSYPRHEQLPAFAAPAFQKHNQQAKLSSMSGSLCPKTYGTFAVPLVCLQRGLDLAPQPSKSLGALARRHTRSPAHHATPCSGSGQLLKNVAVHSKSLNIQITFIKLLLCSVFSQRHGDMIACPLLLFGRDSFSTSTAYHLNILTANIP
jgi:hypothetical protein